MNSNASPNTCSAAGDNASERRGSLLQRRRTNGHPLIRKRLLGPACCGATFKYTWLWKDLTGLTRASGLSRASLCQQDGCQPCSRSAPHGNAPWSTGGAELEVVASRGGGWRREHWHRTGHRAQGSHRPSPAVKQGCRTCWIAGRTE